MPTYEYECTSCGQHIEAFQRFSEDPLTMCGSCGGVLRKVFHPVGIVFKGSGFYATDSRAGTPAPAAAKKDGSDASGKGTGASDGAGSSPAGGSGSSDADSTGSSTGTSASKASKDKSA
jgi:putative FmdB family regulatory protein